MIHERLALHFRDQPQTPVRAKRKILFGTLLLCLSVATICFGKITDLMLVQGVSYRQIADENRLFRIPVAAARGVIFDRTGKPLTQNVSRFFLATSSAQKLFGDTWSLPEISADQAFSYLIASPSSIFIRSQRSGFVDPALQHVIGYTDYADAAQSLSNNFLDARIGKTGIEKIQNDKLQGMPGKQVIEISALGVPQRSILLETPPQNGQDVTISLDQELSKTAYEAMGEQSGAVVVSDVETGQVLVLTSAPSFSIASLSAALHDDKKPLLNRALAAYPPGSTFKLMTALTALENQTITKDTTVVDEGELRLGQQVFGNWYWRQYGRTEGEISLERAIARSNDIYFYKAAATVGPDKIDEVARQFGIGRSTGIELPSEAYGLLPNSAWKEQKIGEKWYTGDTYNMGIGQGYVLSTPIQVNNMTATVARHGQWCPLTLQLRKDKSCTDVLVEPEYFDLIINGMVGACSTGGTAFPFFPLNEKSSDEQKIACKTGTAEFGAENDKGQKRTHGWFTMFYPKVQAKVAITVFLESTPAHPYLEGSRDGGPIALKVFEKWKEKYDHK